MINANSFATRKGNLPCRGSLSSSIGVVSSIRHADPSSFGSARMNRVGCQAPEAKFRDFHCEQSARPSRALSRCTGILLDLAEVVGWQYGGYASTKREISLATQKTEIEFRSSSIQNEPRYTCNFEISETKTLRSKVEIKNTSKKVYTWIV